MCIVILLFFTLLWTLKFTCFTRIHCVFNVIKTKSESQDLHLLFSFILNRDLNINLGRVTR
jgi:hypothetical protein